MNIIFVTNSYWPQKNGVQMVNQYLAEGLAECGHNVTVLCCGVKEGLEREEIHNHVSIKRFSIYYTKFRKYKGEIGACQKLLVSMDSNGEMDVMITVCANSFAGICTFPIIDKLKCKKILYNHGMRDGKLHMDKITSLKSLLKEVLLGKLDLHYYKNNWKYIMEYNAAIHLFPHDSSYCYFKNQGFKNNYVILNTCEKRFFYTLDVEENTILKSYKLDKPYFLYVANYCTRKDQKRAIDAFFKADIKDKDLILIGSEKNAYCEMLIKYVDEEQKMHLNHGQVHILYGISREDTVAITHNAYVSFLSSMNEYFPLTIIEGMVSGRPFLSTNVGIVSLLPGGSVAHNTNEMIYWLEYFSNHPEYVEQLGNIAYQYAMNNLKLEDKLAEFEKILKA